MEKKLNRLSAVLLLLPLLAGSTFLPFHMGNVKVLADTAVKQTVDTVSENREGPDYGDYLAENATFAAASESIRIAPSEYISDDKNSGEILPEYGGMTNVLKWAAEKDSKSWKFEVPEDGMYTMWLTYCPLPGKQNDIFLGMKLDGEFLFDGMEELSFPRFWQNKGEIRVDDQGNEYAPEQEEIGDYQSYGACDASGQTSAPYTFALTKGTHILELQGETGAFVLGGIEFLPPEVLKPYQEAEEEYKAAGYSTYKGKEIIIQGENAYKKSAKSLIPLADNSDASLTPNDPYKSRINYIGSTNWQAPGEMLAWKFTVPESGLYKMGFRYRQSGVINGFSYRWIRIDGKTPFLEASEAAYSYDSHWQFSDYESKEGEPYLLYLTEGEHELSMSVTLGEMAEYNQRLEEIAYSIGDLYLKIAMITGETPDPNWDYDLFRQIPGFNDILKTNMEAINQLAKDMGSLTGKKSGSYVAALNNMSRVLKSMLDNPYTAQQYKKDYYNNYCNISSWLYEIKKMPLDIDEIRFGAPEQEFKNQKAGILHSLSFSLKRFLASFQKDDNESTDSKEEAETIKLWVNWGRDQAQILNSLIQDSFTPQTGIQVKLEVVNASLIQGILSGNQPDCALMMARTEPVNLAMRGALYDLTGFSDYEEVIKRFQSTAMVPYELNGGIYALPDSQSFYMMFYRTDILEKLGLKVPETWEDFIEVSAAIQRNNMSVGLPLTQITDMATVNTGIGGLTLFPTLLSQSEIPLYNESLTETKMDSPEVIKVFSGWTDYYTKLKFPVTFDFYNRFRVGTMPLGIQGYSLYTTLMSAAPEIKNRWEMAPIPGIKAEDGTIRRTEAGSGTGAAILEKSGHKQAAWEFLKWWTSADTQLRYSNNLESVLGTVGRHATSNVEAFENMSWKSYDLKKLMTQWEDVEEFPEVPGGYYTIRALDQAYWSVINRNDNAKDAMLQWSQTANNEIKRKLREYDLDQ